MPSHAYYGRNATEALLSFRAAVDVPFSPRATLADLNREGRLRQEALSRLDTQIQHLMGTFQSVSFQQTFGYPGVLGEAYNVRFLSITSGSLAGRRVLHYDFKGRVVFHKGAFRSGAERRVPVRLPLSPDLIYDMGIVRGANRCTDPHYSGEEDFWYFWDPELRGCPLAGGSPAILTTVGALQPIPNTQLSYPEYDQLFGPNGNGDLVDAWVFIGYINDIDNYRRVNRRDDAVRALKFVDQDLRGRGFVLTEHRDAFREYADGRRVQGINYFKVYERRVRTLGRDVVMRVNVLLADTDVGSRDRTFHRYLVPAMERGDIIIYDGHSGLGANVDLATLPNIRFNPRKYQIMFFNGCSSYPYFNGAFFRAKGGTQHLDIVTSGLPTFSDSAGPNIVTFLDRFIDGEPRSWQKILSELEVSNGQNGTYLTGVNGDHDNRWRP